MAHGFLSYQDSRGKSGIERALEDYLEKKFKDLKEHLFRERKKTDQKIDEVSVKVEGPAALGAGQQPLLSGGNQKAVAAAPLQRMLGGTALQKSIAAGPSAINPEVYGGGLARGGFNGRPLKSEGFVSDRIVNIGSTNLGVERDIGGDDMFVKRMEPVGGDSGEVVQAIDRLTMVTMGLVAATKQQTQVQQQIAQTQQQEAEKLGRKSLAASEEFALEQGGDFSNNAAYMGLGANGMALMGAGGGGSRRGGGPGMGFGGKAMAARLGRSVMKRGGARAGTRLGIALGGRMSKGLGKGLGKKLGGKAIGKLAGGALAKSLGKKIPLVGLGLGAVFAAQRALQGDFLGAGLELASGAASTIPGAGTAASVGIDAALAAKDMTSFSEGGIPTGDNVVALLNDRPDKKREAVLPLTDKTFLDFGEGILNAQKKNKNTFAKLQAQGLSQYYDKQSGWSGFIDGFIKVFKQLTGGIKVFGKKLFNWGNDGDDDSSSNDGISGEKGDPKIKLGSSEEARIAAALVTEGAGGTASTDILQVLANRMESGKYGKSYTDILSAEGQFAGVFDRYGAGNEEKAISEFRGISSIEDAAAFAGVSEKVIKQRIADMRNAELRKSSAEHVGGALEFRAAPGYYTANGGERLVEGEMGSDGRFYGSSWRGGSGDNQYLTTAGKDPMLSSGAASVDYDGMTTTPDEKPDEKPDPPAGADWTKSLNLGNQPFIDFGDDNQFRAAKNGNGGYTITKKTGFLGARQRIETKGKNLDLKPLLIEAAAKEVSSLNPTTDNDSDKLATTVDNPDALNIASADAQTASAGATTINYITNNTSGDKSSGGGDDVALGTNFDGMGPNPIFTTMAFRAA
jgi:hypothetical protein